MKERKERNIRLDNLDLDSFTDPVFSMLNKDKTIENPTFVKKEGDERDLGYLKRCKRQLLNAIAFNERQRSHK
jgi:hypothetical protein